MEIKVGNTVSVGTLKFRNQTYNIFLNENSNTGSYVTTVQAYFTSGGPGIIRYSFASGNEENTFHIEPTTGKKIYYRF